MAGSLMTGSTVHSNNNQITDTFSPIYMCIVGLQSAMLTIVQTWRFIVFPRWVILELDLWTFNLVHD